MPSEILFTGPTSVVAGASSTNFTMTPTFSFTGVYTFGDGGKGGTFTPTSLTWVASSAPQTFVYNAPATPGISQILPTQSGGPTSFCNPEYIDITVTSSAAPSQHTYWFPQVVGPPPFPVVWWRDQVAAADMPPNATTYGQSIVPSSAPTPATATLTYILNAPAPTGGVTITPVATNGSFSPTSVTIAAGNTTGSTTFSDAVVGVSTISSTNNIGLTDPPNITFTVTSSGGYTATCYGTTEAGGCAITNLAAGAAYVAVGPLQCTDRRRFSIIVFAAGSGTFNLDYQFTTDQGATWEVGKQVVASLVGADGTTQTYEARFAVAVGYQWRVVLYNTSGGTINVEFENRYVSRRGA